MKQLRYSGVRPGILRAPWGTVVRRETLLVLPVGLRCPSLLLVWDRCTNDGRKMLADTPHELPYKMQPLLNLWQPNLSSL
jgi:hypothetical protein